ncbi:hypothetical protein M7I_7785 [Glarea lozoyensis 74030]|uniref:Uncharacterized protein n=1 Tax=Glarea lozoyensis (strain ATCC 74030 / MF5533) TaxID=1104152 RepID=H0EY87_GLAL7|nr:hypothetical protein M7I_7785 [Glarea lozoyensis 74030]
MAFPLSSPLAFPLSPHQVGPEAEEVVKENHLNHFKPAPRKYETDLGSGSSDSSKELVSITDDEQSVHRSGSPSVHESSRRGRRLGSSSSTSSEIYHADQHIPKRSKAKRRGSKAERAPDGHKEIRTDTENNSSQGSENVDMEEEEKDLVEQEEAERIMDEFLATFTETGEQ